MTKTKRTFCRVCEPACGMIAEVDGNQITSLKGDKDHPITKGFVCHKGIYGLDIHNDPDRLNYPLKRNSDGELERIDWPTAISEIGDKLKSIVDASGPKAFGAYRGNPMSFNTMFWASYHSLQRQMGTTRIFSSGTQDCTNKFAGSGLVFGSQAIHPLPDIENTDFLMMVGENPAVSHMSFMSIADPVAKLRGIEERGGKVVFVNPRQIETARHVGEVAAIKPDTDVYLFAAILHEIHEKRGFECEDARKHGLNLEALARFVADYSPAEASAVTGLSEEEITELAAPFCDPSVKASVHMSTGVNMGRQGTLAYWLLHMISFVSGNLGHKGGNYISRGLYTPLLPEDGSARDDRSIYAHTMVDGPFGPMHDPSRSYIDMPGNLIADYINDADEPMRALLVTGGNPVLSIGGEGRMRDSFEKLDLLVCIDIYANATSEHADYILPAAGAFERPDMNRAAQGHGEKGALQFTEALVEPAFERKTEWWILERLLQQMGHGSYFNDETNPDPAETFTRFIEMRLERAGVDPAAMRTTGVAEFESEPPEWFYRYVPQVDCFPSGFSDAIERMGAIFEELASEPQSTLKLVTKRDNNMMNSWYSNLPKLKRKERAQNYLFMNPEDAQDRQLSDGELVAVANENGRIELPLKVSDEFRRGVVATPHGWGHAGANGLSFAKETPGVNCNKLLPSGPGSFEPLSNQAHMTGIAVEVTKAQA